MNAFRQWCVAMVLCVLATGSVWAGEGGYNESAWREYRSAKRKQVSELCELWFPDYRPRAVGQTYLTLAGRYDEMDLSKCSPALRKHVKKAECACTEISELLALGASFPDLSKVLIGIRAGQVEIATDTTVSSERGLRILELLRTLAESEEAVVRELRLDE